LGLLYVRVIPLMPVFTGQSYSYKRLQTGKRVQSGPVEEAVQDVFEARRERVAIVQRASHAAGKLLRVILEP